MHSQQPALPKNLVALPKAVGSRKAVLETIHTLYRLGFASVGDWSQLQRAANKHQVMSVLIRRRQRKA